MDVDITPVVAMLMGLGLLGPVGLNLTDGVSAPLRALGDRPEIPF